MTRFISPETASMVRARLATSMPSPANERAPSTVMNATALNEPRTPTWNIHQPKPTSAATSRNRNTSRDRMRSEEHTSELQSHSDLVCRLLLEKKKQKKNETKQT